MSSKPPFPPQNTPGDASGRLWSGQRPHKPHWMPDKYDDLIFGEDDPEDSNKWKEEDEFVPMRFSAQGIEPLDQVLQLIEQFQRQAVPFSRLLSQARAIDHKPSPSWLGYIFITSDPHDQTSLRGEREYHEYLSDLFRDVIIKMKGLAAVHQKTVQGFNRDIGEAYYSIEKTDRQVRREKARALKGIALQRRILDEGSEALGIFRDALAATEKRMRKYVDAGGRNNISASEVALITSSRQKLTSGKEHGFDYGFFRMNALDRTSANLGIYMKETSKQYLSRLSDAFFG